MRGAKERVHMLSKNDGLNYDLDLETSFKDTLHQRLFVGEVLARLDQGERMNDPDDDFADSSAMTITIVQT